MQTTSKLNCLEYRHDFCGQIENVRYLCLYIELNQQRRTTSGKHLCTNATQMAVCHSLFYDRYNTNNKLYRYDNIDSNISWYCVKDRLYKQIGRQSRIISI